MSLAIINLPTEQEVLDDLNNIIFSVIDNNTMAQAAWDEVMGLISGGCSEEFIYDELPHILKIYNDETLKEIDNV